MTEQLKIDLTFRFEIERVNFITYRLSCFSIRPGVNKRIRTEDFPTRRSARRAIKQSLGDISYWEKHGVKIEIEEK